MKHRTDPNPQPTGITFGAMCDPLHAQLQWPERRCKFPQRIADAITLLSIHRFLSESETHRSRKRLMKRIEWMWKNPGR